MLILVVPSWGGTARAGVNEDVAIPVSGNTYVVLDVSMDLGADADIDVQIDAEGPYSVGFWWTRRHSADIMGHFLVMMASEDGDAEVSVFGDRVVSWASDPDADWYGMGLDSDQRRVLAYVASPEHVEGTIRVRGEVDAEVIEVGQAARLLVGNDLEPALYASSTVEDRRGVSLAYGARQSPSVAGTMFGWFQPTDGLSSWHTPDGDWGTGSIIMGGRPSGIYEFGIEFGVGRVPPWLLLLDVAVW